MKRGEARRDLDLADRIDEDFYKAWTDEFTAMAIDGVPDDPDQWWALNAWGMDLLRKLRMADGVRHGTVHVEIEDGEAVFTPRPIP